MPRATYRMKEQNGRKFSVVGTGLTRAAAIAEANAKLAMTVGTIESSSVSDALVGAEIGEAFDEAGGYSDAVLSLKNAAGRIVNVHLENVTNGIGDGVTGDIVLDNALVEAFALAYRDGEGAGGYEPYGGHFVA